MYLGHLSILSHITAFDGQLAILGHPMESSQFLQSPIMAPSGTLAWRLDHASTLNRALIGASQASQGKYVE